MLAAAMESLLSPLCNPGRISYVLLEPGMAVGSYFPPDDIAFPIDLEARGDTGKILPADLCAGAMYVLCYQPLHPSARAFQELARAYVQTHDPQLPGALLRSAKQAQDEGDWVGTIGRIWSVVQLDLMMPVALEELARACYEFAWEYNGRDARALSVGLMRASAQALNQLMNRYPESGPGHLQSAELFATVGQWQKALGAVRQAIALGLPEDLEERAERLYAELSAGMK